MDELGNRIASFLFEGQRWPLLLLLLCTYFAYWFTGVFFYPDSDTRQARDTFRSPFFWGAESALTLTWTGAYIAVVQESSTVIWVLQGGLIAVAVAESGLAVARLPRGRAREQVSHLLSLVSRALLQPIPWLTRRSAMGSALKSSQLPFEWPIPDSFVKPKPRTSTFEGCPAEGDGGDTELNILKNRIDESVAFPVPFETLVALPWPDTRRPRDSMSRAELAVLRPYEGVPVAVEGYLAGLQKASPMSQNCHSTKPEQLGWLLVLVRSPFEARTEAVIAQVTPRVRVAHPAWTLKHLERYTLNRTPVRLSGWLLLNQVHLNHVGHFRATPWEITPVTRIEVWVNNNWASVEDIGSQAGSGRAARRTKAKNGA